MPKPLSEPLEYYKGEATRIAYTVEDKIWLEFNGWRLDGPLPNDPSRLVTYAEVEDLVQEIVADVVPPGGSTDASDLLTGTLGVDRLPDVPRAKLATDVRATLTVADSLPAALADVADDAAAALAAAATAQAAADDAASDAAGGLAAHAADTTSVHGIADTAALALKTETAVVQTALDAHAVDTTSVHGIADTAALALKTETAAVQAALTAGLAGKADASALAGKADTSTVTTLSSQLAALQAAIAATIPKPVAAFSANLTLAAAPFIVEFTDTSLDKPTSWSWNFGDGGTSTDQHPTHTYTTAGVYTVTLTATNLGGSSTYTTIVTAVADTGTGTIDYITSGALFASTTASANVGLALPAGIQNGDLLVATFNADNQPTISTVPSGWLPLCDPVVGSGTTLFGYYLPVPTASAVTGTQTWVLSSAQKANGAIELIRGADLSNPFASDPVYVVNDAAAIPVVLPEIKPTIPNGLLYMGIGVNSSGADVSSASGSGFTETFEADGGQTARGARKAYTTAGKMGPYAANLAVAQTAVGFMRALRRAGATTPSGTKLTWAPPTLDSNYKTYNVQAGDRILNLDPAFDWRIVWPNYPIEISSDFQIVGGKNVVSIGGEVRFTAAGRQLLIQNASSPAVNNRTVHVEGLRMTAASGVQMTEGININAQDDTGLVVRLQNIIVAPIWGLPAYHADIIQAFNGPYQLDVDLLEGSSNYQGFMIQPNNSGEDLSYPNWNFKRIRVEMRNDRTDGGSAGFVLLTTNVPYPVVDITDMQITGAGASSSKLTQGSPTSGNPPANSTSGMSIVASYTGARATAGVGYVSPGYL